MTKFSILPIFFSLTAMYGLDMDVFFTSRAQTKQCKKFDETSIQRDINQFNKNNREKSAAFSTAIYFHRQKFYRWPTKTSGDFQESSADSKRQPVHGTGPLWAMAMNKVCLLNTLSPTPVRQPRYKIVLEENMNVRWEMVTHSVEVTLLCLHFMPSPVKQLYTLCERGC